MEPKTYSEQDQLEWERVLAPSLHGDAAGTMFRLRKHLRKHYAVSMMAIGRLLEVGGKNIPQDYLRAKKCYEKALAREPGLIEAMLGLARLHYFGRGMERDVGTAKQFYERVEKSGDPIALYMLGHISWNDERNLVDAREYFARCAATGHVGATMRLAELRIRCGQRISGGMKWLWALARVLFVSIRNAHDERLRMC